MMTSQDAIRRRMLEIKDKINYFEERICFIPSSREEAQRSIGELKDELKRLDSEYYRGTHVTGTC